MGQKSSKPLPPLALTNRLTPWIGRRSSWTSDRESPLDARELPCRSLTETIIFPFSSRVTGWVSFSSQRWSGRAVNLLARFWPAGMPSIAKSAVTVKLARSSPLP